MKIVFRKKINTEKKKAEKTLGRDIYKDWRLLLVGFFVLVICAVAFAGYLFFGIQKGELFIVAPSASTESSAFDGKTIDDLVQRFAEKAAKLERLRGNISTSSDPF